METDSPKKSGRSPDIRQKTDIMCSNMPSSLFESATAKEHFGKFGRVKKILLRPKKQICVVEYYTPAAAQQALLNAGAYDGFMFDVTWNKKKKLLATAQKKEDTPRKRRSSQDEDPDWVPDSDVEEELSAMGNVPVYRPPRKAPQEERPPPPKQQIVRRVEQARPPVQRKIKEIPPPWASTSQAAASMEEAPIVNVPTTLSTAEAAAELSQLRTRASRTADKQRRTLDARDKILRAWGGTGSRVKAGGAIIGTCPDMCPEKERLQRQVEHQVNMLECERDGAMCEWRAVKQYSRSSADQETPMCYELRPPAVLTMTMTYLLWEIADLMNDDQVSLADWFQFMWDRCRSIRKDITQQALCCAESVRLVEQCARFHAHCAARLADLEHSQFDQKLNTDNLTKCLQTLKHMYADLPQESKPNEAEFRSYIALLNMGDAKFFWEIKQLPLEIQKCEAIKFAVQIFMALDNNNYVRFFRLVRDKATYLQACILLRYFNDVRARGLARIVKAFSPRGGSKYPIDELMDNLGFEDENSLHLFVTHYGLSFSKHSEYDPSVILDRNQFIEDSDPYPVSRAINLIESKIDDSVGEIIAGGPLPSQSIYTDHRLHSSFNDDGTLKESALLADDLGYGTTNESNNDLNSLRKALEDYSLQSTSIELQAKQAEPKTIFAKPDQKPIPSIGQMNVFSAPKTESKPFSFKPAIPVVSSDSFKSPPEKKFSQETNTTFAFSKPEDTKSSNLWADNQSGNVFASSKSTAFGKPTDVFGVKSNTQTEKSNIFSEGASNIFGSSLKKIEVDDKKQSLFMKPPTVTTSSELTPFQKFTTASSSIFNNIDSSSTGNSAKQPINIFVSGKIDNASSSQSAKSVFGQTTGVINPKPGDVFKSSAQPIFDQNKQPYNLFGKPENSNQNDPKVLFGGSNNIFQKQPSEASIMPPSPKSLFSSALAQNADVNQPDYIFGENKVLSGAFGQHIDTTPQEDELMKHQRLQEQIMMQQREQEEKRRIEEARQLEEQRIQEQKRLEEMRRQELIRKEEIKRKQEEQRKQEELRQKMEEERRQAEIKRLAEERRKAEEKQRLLIQIDKESRELVDELVELVSQEFVEQLTNMEMLEMKNLCEYANNLSNELVNEVCHEICVAETKAEKFLIQKLMEKYGGLWMAFTARNIRRRALVQETPVWLASASPRETAELLRREVLPAALSKMKEFHKGNIFTGNIKPEPPLTPYNIMEIIKNSFLKGLKNIKINYHECFFWKLTVSPPPSGRWLHKKVNVYDWILNKFSDTDCDTVPSDVIYLKKQTWNNLMNFGISVSIMEESSNALIGSNGIVFYADESDSDYLTRIQNTLQKKPSRQSAPIALIIGKNDNINTTKLLDSLQASKIISVYKIYEIDQNYVISSIDKCTKSALKWLAKNIPSGPSLEMDTLESVLHQCIGMEFWYRLKLERNTRMDYVFKDLNKLVELYNIALDKLMEMTTQKSLWANPSFAPELKRYLFNDSLMPKSYEFFPDDWNSPKHIEIIKDILDRLKLRQPKCLMYATQSSDLINQVKNFCDETEWFENSGQVCNQIISHLPKELSDHDTDVNEYSQLFDQYDFLDMITIVVLEKLRNTPELRNKFVYYDKETLTDYRKSHWWYNIDMVSAIKHKALDFIDDDIDISLNESLSSKAKRRKCDESDEMLALEEKDEDLVEESINKWDEEIVKINSYNVTVKEIEKRLDEESVKASNLEEILRAALLDV